MTAPFGPSYVRAIAPYIAGKPISEVAREFGLDEATIVKLASNENPLGMPESAQRAMAQAVARTRPLSGLQRLRAEGGAERALRRAGRLDHARQRQQRHPRNRRACVRGEGPVDRLCAVLVRGVRAGDARPGRARDRRAGRRLRPRPRRDGSRPSPTTRAWSSSPIRTIRPAPSSTAPQLEAFLDKVPRNVVVVLDEAYTEYLPAEQALRLDRLGAPVSEPAGVAHLLEGLRPGRPARRFRDRAAGADRSAESHPPAVQRELAGAGRGDRRAQRHGVPARRARR